MAYDTSDLAKAKVLLDATRYAIATPKKRYQFSEFCLSHNFPTFAAQGKYNQDYKNLNGEWHILLKRYNSKQDLCVYLEERIRSLSSCEEVVIKMPLLDSDFSKPLDSDFSNPLDSAFSRPLDSAFNRPLEKSAFITTLICFIAIYIVVTGLYI